MKILKTLISVEGEGVGSCDTVEHEGKLWLVPEWINGTPTKGFSKPARIICLTSLSHTVCRSGADYTLQNPIPRAVLQGHVPSQLKDVYVVIETPDIVVETPPTFH